MTNQQPTALRLADAIESRTHTYGDVDAAADELRRLHEECNKQARLLGMSAERELRLRAITAQLLEALELAEAGLADIGDADREPGDDLAWCERRAAEPLPVIRAAIAAAKEQA